MIEPKVSNPDFNERIIQTESVTLHGEHKVDGKQMDCWDEYHLVMARAEFEKDLAWVALSGAPTRLKK